MMFFAVIMRNYELGFIILVFLVAIFELLEIYFLILIPSPKRIKKINA
ncbi:hypothetical protein XBP1_270033 [Xenorhabdus bovienii str. puntauvense]|uniref:Uncharacterized protein n=3 Tax=Xenorhabdus bovienii TaxID=40576 RepID=A0A0B6X849_XENBV|nr:hypothetical protein XBP1_270033 [Xenorhabdus bovienii str. puntauvense]CDH03803.1 hypothetical protein XBFM1_850040 [Xenorhabdus bovienii str. feltiae Moldova]CDM89730.1 protein of unknown function [Xenorhabdus bovienii]